jgi:hypothetical protein
MKHRHNSLTATHLYAGCDPYGNCMSPAFLESSPNAQDRSEIISSKRTIAPRPELIYSFLMKQYPIRNKKVEFSERNQRSTDDAV